MEAGVVDRQRGGGREAEGQFLVDVREAVLVLLVGEVEVAEHLASDVERHPQVALHRRVVGREAEAVGMFVEIG